MRPWTARILVGLLIVRVLAAPLALRPREGGPRPRYGLTVRLCPWPAPRLGRVSPSSELLESFRGGGRPGAAAPHLPVSPGSPGPLHLRGPSAMDASPIAPARHPAERLRC